MPEAANHTPEEMPKAYASAAVEQKWLARWMQSGVFHADPNSLKKKYSIVIPPPNVTGILHMGHALNNTLQDILARYRRMQGHEVLWQVGTDHAGIATQNVVERSLRAQGLDRKVMGRDKFLEHTWAWREKYGGTILEQLKKMGFSCDWSRVRFTMDEGLSLAVRTVFVKLYEKNLIYKGNYIINWCPRCQTALSDEEVTHREVQGNFYHIRYRVSDSNESVVIATTRPETMLGDTAIGHHPKDERYAFLKGKTVELPLLKRKLRVIQDDMIDREFGTGALKITPGHDPVDFELGRKHGLESINILNPDGTLNENAGYFRSLDRFEARKRVVKDLETQGFLVKIEPHMHSVGHCYRCDTIVEPYCSPQWFVKMKPLAWPSIKAVKKGEVRFHPERWTKVYLDWMENIRDWCISRQIWWGHRIPVWTCPDCLKKDSHARPIVAIETPKQCPKCKSKNLIQDEDVLDTWFSSWLWPFSTMGWPEKTPELKKFYPTDALVTGYEIIFFWVARMLMAGFEFMGKKPFSDIYIHGIVRDIEGQKMSKSKGNVIDPIEVAAEVGVDGLRYGMISITSEGQDVFAGKERFEIGRNFANKIWNASRFVLMNLPKGEIKKPNPKELSAVDLWILSRLHRLVERVTQSLDNFRFNDAASALYDFFWGEFCDWYLEFSKLDAQKPACQWVLREVLTTSIRLLHPFMPFITEELWTHLNPGAKEFLSKGEWPQAEKKFMDEKIEHEVALVIEQIQSIRNVRAAWKIDPKNEIAIGVKTSDAKDDTMYEKYASYVKRLARIGSIQHQVGLARPGQSVVACVGVLETYVVLAGLVDVDLEKKRISGDLEAVEKHLNDLEKRLGNEQFVSKAPKDVVQKEKEKQRELQEKRTRLAENLKVLQQ